MKTFFSSLAVAVLTMAGMARAQVTALDSGFAPDIDGSVNVISSASAAGSYYIAGDFTQVSSTARTRVARIAADGSLDTAFDPGTSANSAIYALQPESGGGVLVAGGFTLFNGQARPALCRLTSSGAVDPAVSTTATMVTAMAVNGGYLYAAGNFPRSDAPGQYSFRVVRMAYPAGFTGNNYDPSYTEPTITGTVSCLFFQADGKLVIGGDFTAVNGTTRTNLARLNADGTLDTVFTITAAGGGVRTLANYAPGTGLLVVGGEFTTMAGGSAHAYYGVVNLSLNAMVTTPKPATNGPVRSIISYGSGDLLLGGDFGFVGTASRVRVARVNVLTGRVDPALDLSANGSVRALMLDASVQNRIVIGGSFTQVGTTARKRLARLLPFGAIDTGWPEATGGEVRATAVQTNDATLVGGSFTALGGAPRTGLGRVLASGVLDTTYAPVLDGSVNAIAALPDGRALIGGSFTSVGGAAHANLARLNADGTVDATFTTDTDVAVTAIAQQADGKVYVAGSFATIGGVARTGVARLNADGTVDTAFDAALNGLAQTVIVQPDGKVLIGGYFTTVGGTLHPRLARVDATGALDSTFTATLNGGALTLNLDAVGDVLVGGSFPNAWNAWFTSTGTAMAGGTVFLNGSMRSSAIDSSGTTYLGGVFTSANDGTSTTTGPIAHLEGLNVSPTLPVTGLGANVRTIAARSDGALVVGGTFGSFGDTTRSNLGLWVPAEAASSVLTVNGTGTSVTWARSGAAPSPTFVAFDLSTDSGVTWTPLGIAGAPTISGSAWVSTLAITTPAGVPYLVRGRGLVGDGVSSSWIQAVSALQLRQLPTITTEPQDQTINPGAYASFSVTASSPTSMSYKWFKDGTLLPSLTSSTISVLGQTAGTFAYMVEVSNVNGSVTSRSAIMTVRAPVAITTQPVSATVPIGSTGTVSVVATGDSPTYQWQEYRYNYSYPYGYQWINLPGATSSSYSSTATAANPIRVVVSNAFSSVSSGSVFISIVSPPTFNITPNDQTINVGNSLTLQASTASAAQGNTYQWFKDDEPISGATSYNHYVSVSQLSDAGRYYVVATNIAGTATSRTATVKVFPNTPPVITRDLPSLMVMLGQPTELGLDYSGLLGMAFEWRRNGALLHWVTSPSFAVGGSMADSGIYTCKITNSLGSTNSRYASVVVVDTSTSSVAQPLHGTVTLKAPTTALGVSYRWQKGGADITVSSRIASVTSASLIIKDLALADAGDYTCIIGNGTTTITGGAITLIVQDKVPAVTTASLPDAAVAVVYDAQLAGSELPTKFTVSGLPDGLKCDTLGHITGTPTESGTFPLKAIASNGVGKSIAKSLSLKVLTLPTGLTGSWMGISGAHRIDATIATSGVMTGTIQIGNVVRQFRTSISITGATDGLILSCKINHPSFGVVDVSGAIGLAAVPGMSVNLNYVIPSIGQTTATVILWSRAPASELPKLKGYYTASLDNPSPSGFSVPEGSGYAAITVGSTGSTTVSGRLADGSAHSTSGFVGRNGEVAVFDAPIAGKSFLNGVMQIVAGTPPNYYDNSISGTFDWSRSPITGRLFPDGFALQLSANGYKYLKPNLGLLTGPIVMNLVNAPGNAQLSFSISNEGSGGASQGRISTSNQFSLQGGGAFSSASVTINAATGVFTAAGTFSSSSYYITTPIRRSGKGYGIIVSNPSTLGGLGKGYVILPLIPQNVGETLSNTPQVSGSVSLGSS